MTAEPYQSRSRQDRLHSLDAYRGLIMVTLAFAGFGLAETAANEPSLTSGLGVIARLIADVTARGIPRERVVLLGFSQGACLSSEFAVRNPGRYGGVMALSGGLIGPRGIGHDVARQERALQLIVVD